MFYAEVGEKDSTLHACWLRKASIALTSASLFLGFQIARKHSSSNGEIMQISMSGKVSLEYHLLCHWVVKVGYFHGSI